MSLDDAAWESARTEALSRFAADKESVRVPDEFGRLFVKTSHISKAGVNPYFGREIPGWQELGLDSNRVYKLLRDPEELARSAPTFNAVQVLVGHIPVSAGAPQTDSLAGTTGTNTTWNAPFLDSELSIWTQEGIDLIESEEQRELSACYRYRPDMTPGFWAETGEPYDGVMRDIVGNHVALVKKGRAGADVLVGDADIDPKAAGICLYAPDGSVLFLKRADDGTHDQPGTWCFPGGGIEAGETPVEAARRELAEETGHQFGGDLEPLDQRTGFATFTGQSEKFEPTLNEEHTEARWAMPADAPQPLHTGVAATLAETLKPSMAGDGLPKEMTSMTKRSGRKAVLSRTAARVEGALTGLLANCLAADKALDLKPAVSGITAKNLKAKAPALVAWIKAAAERDGFALDAMPGVEEAVAGGSAGASPDDVIMRILDMVEGEATAEEVMADQTDANPADPNAAPPSADDPDDANGAGGGEADAFLQAKLGPEDYAKYLELAGNKGPDDGSGADPAAGGEDEDPAGETEEEKAKRMAAVAKDNEENKTMVSREAMDAALKAVGNQTEARIRATFRGAQEAREAVRPWVGEVSMAYDSAPDIYRAALKSLGVQGVDALPTEALRPILDNLPKPNTRRREEATVAMDAATVGALDARFPHLAHVHGA